MVIELHIHMKRKSFWVTNFSDRNVSLTDLYISIPANKSVNLLDEKHYHFTEQQLINSATSGSIYKKSHLLAVRKIPPNAEIKEPLMIYSSAIPSRSKSIYEIHHENYEELNISDEEEELITIPEAFQPKGK